MRILPLASYRPPRAAADLGAARRAVAAIVDAVQAEGGAALRRFSLRFDGCAPRRLRATRRELAAARASCPPGLREAIAAAAANLERFARRQMADCRGFSLEVVPGVRAGQRLLPIDRVGIYVPGGRHPLVSSLLMAAVPARIAGVSRIVVCSPPGGDGRAAPAVLAAAGILGLDEVYALGGAQAVAAMAYGAGGVPRVDKIVGPGNLYVTLAKQLVFGRVGIDLPAGPSEIAILADASARPEWVAADLLAQAEHDPLAVPLLVTTSRRLALAVAAWLRRQLPALTTAGTARRSLEANGMILLAPSLERAVAFLNRLAPEHLELQVAEPERWAARCRAFGSLFVGPLAAEALGDYSSGLNHVLPTAGAARFSGGLSVRDFLRFATTLRIDRGGLRRIAPTARTLAQAEGLAGHDLSLALRLSGA